MDGSSEQDSQERDNLGTKQECGGVVNRLGVARYRQGLEEDFGLLCNNFHSCFTGRESIRFEPVLQAGLHSHQGQKPGFRGVHLPGSLKRR